MVCQEEQLPQPRGLGRGWGPHQSTQQSDSRPGQEEARRGISLTFPASPARAEGVRGLSQLAGEQLFAQEARGHCSLSQNISSVLWPVWSLVGLPASMSPPLKEANQTLLVALLSGSGQTERWVGIGERRPWQRSQSPRPVSVVVNRHNYYYLERWARGGQGHVWGE